MHLTNEQRTLGHQEFRELPTHMRNTLLRADFFRRQQLAELSDEELLKIRLLGRKTLARIRAMKGAQSIVEACPHCGGRGYIERQQGGGDGLA